MRQIIVAGSEEYLFVINNFDDVSDILWFCYLDKMSSSYVCIISSTCSSVGGAAGTMLFNRSIDTELFAMEESILLPLDYISTQLE